MQSSGLISASRTVANASLDASSVMSGRSRSRISAEIIGDREGREPRRHIDPACPGDEIDRAAEHLRVDALDGAMQILPVVTERRAEARAGEMPAAPLAFGGRIAGARELAADQFAHPLLQIRKAVEAEPIGEAHHRRRIDVELGGHLIDGRERHRLRMLDDVLGDPLLRLGQPVVVAPKLLDHVARADRRGRRSGSLPLSLRSCASPSRAA